MRVGPARFQCFQKPVKTQLRHQHILHFGNAHDHFAVRPTLSVHPRRRGRFLRAEGIRGGRGSARTGVGCNASLASLMNFSGFSRLATEMSSSISSQWMPIPLPMSSQSFLCFSVAFRSLGNHIKGTDTVRPSSNTTVIASVEQDTSTAIASLLATKVGIPSLQEKFSIRLHKFTDNRQLVVSKAAVRRQIHRIKPELCVTPSVGNVNVRWLAILQTVEEESISTNPEQYRHGLSLHPLP